MLPAEDEPTIESAVDRTPSQASVRQSKNTKMASQEKIKETLEGNGTGEGSRESAIRLPAKLAADPPFSSTLGRYLQGSLRGALHMPPRTGRT